MKAILPGIFLLLALLPRAEDAMPGIKPGAQAPGFHLRDQFGKEWSLDSLMGTNGLVLLFFRSADW